jgi:hypothetical protein
VAVQPVLAPDRSEPRDEEGDADRSGQDKQAEQEAKKDVNARILIHLKRKHFNRPTVRGGPAGSPLPATKPALVRSIRNGSAWSTRHLS